MRKYGQSYIPKEKNQTYKLIFVPPVMVALVGLAYSYAFITVYNPAPKLNFLVTIGYCFAIGYFYYYVCVIVKTRGIITYLFILLFFGILTIHIFWASYLHAIYQKEVELMSLLTEPCLVVDYISKYADNTKYVDNVFVNAMGWVVESGLFMFSLFMGVSQIADIDYCDLCDVILETDFAVAYFNYPRPEELLYLEDVGNMSFLEDCEPANYGDRLYYRLALKKCPKCEWTYLVSIAEITVIKDDGKDYETKKKTLHHDILISKLALAIVNAHRDRLKYNPDIRKSNSNISRNEESKV